MTQQHGALCALITLVLILLYAPIHAHARDGFSYGLSAVTIMDSNPLTRSDDTPQDEIIGTETTASVIFTYKKPQQSLSAQLDLTRSQFNVSGFNSNDAAFTTRAQKKMKRWLLNLTGKVDRDTTRTASIDTRGTNNASVENRTTLSLAPSVIYNYTPLSSIGLNTSWTRRLYEDETTLTSYQTYSLSPFLFRQISPRHTASIALQYQNYSSLSGSDIEVNSVGPFMSWEYYFRPNMALEFSLGFLGTKYEGFGIDDNSWEINPIYSAKLTYEGRKNNTSLGIDRARQALSNGAEIDTITTSLSNQYTITPRWDLNVSAKYIKAEQSEFSNDNLDSSYGGSLSTTYDISRKLQFSTSYRYLNEDFTNNAGQATRNVIRAGIEYSLD